MWGREIEIFQLIIYVHYTAPYCIPAAHKDPNQLGPKPTERPYTPINQEIDVVKILVQTYIRVQYVLVMYSIEDKFDIQ
jgi:hypothetical protein